MTLCRLGAGAGVIVNAVRVIVVIIKYYVYVRSATHEPHRRRHRRDTQLTLNNETKPTYGLFSVLFARVLWTVNTH